jgi:hypothetical protein
MCYSPAVMRRAKRLFLPVVFSAFLVHLPSSAQDTKAIFHVTSVRTEDAKDWCTTGKCSATRITVEGYSDAVEYVLDCVETIASEPSPHVTVVCDHVHASNDYDVEIGSNYIFFGESRKPSSTQEPLRSGYSIVSEKERANRKR